jgi:hypothetical protein
VKLFAIGILMLWAVIYATAVYGFGFESVMHGLDPSRYDGLTTDLVVDWIVLLVPPTVSIVLLYRNRGGPRKTWHQS